MVCILDVRQCVQPQRARSHHLAVRRCLRATWSGEHMAPLHVADLSHTDHQRKMPSSGRMINGLEANTFCALSQMLHCLWQMADSWLGKHVECCIQTENNASYGQLLHVNISRYIDITEALNSTHNESMQCKCRAVCNKITEYIM